MMQLLQIPPSPALAEFISLYRVIAFELPDMSALPAKAYPPRPETCLQFFLTPGTLFYADPAESIRTDMAMIIGQHNCLTNRIVNERLFSIQVVFTPAGFFRLTGTPATALYNKTLPASDFFGNGIDSLTLRLLESGSDKMRISHIESYFMTLVKKQKSTAHAIDTACRQLLQDGGIGSLDRYVSNSFLSHRQFDRKFIERTGTSAKEFMRITRFYAVYLMKNAEPGKDWLSIALHCGYYDYQHLVRDFRNFTGYTPVRFFELDSPERALGAAEIYSV